ncbi:MAG: hypothetical protein JSU59_03550 [Nitrospirota bacterium]|nr:MAG: hypothetical protein JSU59_03550 [Nitrospirota bacterium]
MPTLILEALVPLRVRHRGQELQWPQGHLLEWSEEEAHKLFTKVPDKVRRVDTGKKNSPDPAPPPSLPLHPGWQVVWRDRHGKLKEGIVKRVEPSPSGWMVLLETGESIPARIISAVGRIENGKKVGTWLVRPHGLGAPAPDDWQTAWREVAALTDGLTENDPQFALVLELLTQCDTAYEQGNYLEFHEHVTEIRKLLNHEP